MITTAASYELAPYLSLAIMESHPRRMGGVATLLGRTPPSPSRARVLELGCASGGNLIPMAAGMPDAYFVGVDFAAGQIDVGRRRIEELGLNNIELIHGNIYEVSLSGSFDYIITHGVYSWVESEVRDQILQIYAECLTPDGIAYISYNTLPGWHLRRVMRDYMLFHSRNVRSLDQRVRLARTGFEELADAVAESHPNYGQLLQAEVRRYREQDDSYLLHEHLETNNHPVYFHQFADHLERAGLRYLSEAQLRYDPSSSPTGIPLPDTLSLVEREQYRDFLTKKEFRCSLICHTGNQAEPVPVDIDASLAKLQFTLSGRLSIEDRLSGNTGFRFDGGHIVVPPGAAHEILTELNRSWPCPLTLEELFGCGERQLLIKDLMALLYSGVVVAELEALSPVHLASLDADARPKSSDLVRYQVRSGMSVTNLRHENIQLTSFQQQILSRIDGEQTRAQLVAWTIGQLAAGTIKVESQLAAPDLATQLVVNSLESLASKALLIET